MTIVKEIQRQAIKAGYKNINEIEKTEIGDKLFFNIRNRAIALIHIGSLDMKQGANMIVTHIDSPRLDVIPGNNIFDDKDGTFFKCEQYGGIVRQLWMDRPLTLVGRAYDDDNNEILINTEGKYTFICSSLPIHLNGREKMKELTDENFNVRISCGTKEDFLKFMQEEYGLTEDNIKTAYLSFVPAGEPFTLGFDNKLIAGYGQDDRSCTFAALKAIIDVGVEVVPQRTNIALFLNYEETGSRQTTGAASRLVDSIFSEIAIREPGLYSEYAVNKFITNTKVVSGDTCFAYESNYSEEFDADTAVYVGKGAVIDRYTDIKVGNEASPEYMNEIIRIFRGNKLEHQLHAIKRNKIGGGTLSYFFAERGMEVIDVGLPILSMHSPVEMIHEDDLATVYRFYKKFFKSYNQ